MNNDFNHDMNNMDNNAGQPGAGTPQGSGQYQFNPQPTGGFPQPDQSKYQFDPQPNAYTPYVQPKTDTYGPSAQIMGILAIVLSFVCCPIVGIVLGALAMSRAKRSHTELGYETSEGKTGNICGIIGLIIGILGTLFWIAYLGIFGIVFFAELEKALSLALPLL